MKTLQTPRQERLLRRIVLALVLTMLSAASNAALAADEISETARTQIAVLMAEKEGRTPAQKKMDSQLVYLAKQNRGELIAVAVPNLVADLKADAENRVLVDINATVSDELLDAITGAGGTIVNHFAAFDAIRALIPIATVESLAARADVRSIAPAAQAITNVGSVLSQGDRTHRADTARINTGATGSGVKIGVLSDGANSLAASIANGNLNAAATFLAGQAGSGDEGTAMMEIIQDLVPDAQLIFATAFSGDTSMANNILALQAAGCSIIVDDVTYLNESPFQDGVISQAVNTVSAAGVMYFSSARNSGNKNDGTSGTWEGDFVNGGGVALPVTGNGNLLDFGGATTFNTVGAGGSSRRVDLFWSDPTGASTNDYDLFVLDSTGASVLRSSTNLQTGTQNPYESTSTLNAAERIVIVQRTGAANRFIHLDTGRAVLAISTQGNVRGHNASGAPNAFSVAATNVANSPNPNFFVGGATNPVETFSSDGPRRIFYSPSGTAITPGNFSSTGGQILNKPDITAADGGSTSVSGFTTFFGTSAAAPHAAAIAGLLRSYNTTLTPLQIRTAMTSTALDIEAVGNDRDSGAGIVMALAGIQAVAAPNTVISGTPLLSATGPVGGSFSPASATYTLTNPGAQPLNWTAVKTQPWTTLSSAGGTLAPGTSTTVTCIFNAAANALGGGTFSDTVTITNTTSGFTRNFNVSLKVIAGVVGTGVGAIPDGTASTPPAFGAARLISFPIAGLVSNVAAVSIDVTLTHPWSGDVDLVLASPGGARSLVLVSRLGATTATAFGSSSGFSGTYTFTDAAAGANIWTAAATSPIPPGSYRTTGAGGAGQTNPPPLTSLIVTFGGMPPAEANGTWTLSARDAASPDTGTVSAAALVITTLSPTVTSLNRVNASPSNAASVNWTLAFSSAVSGVTASNFALSGTAAAAAAVGTPTTADGGLNWNVPVSTGPSNGTLTLSLTNTTGQSPTISTALPFGGQSYTMDKTTQTPTLAAPAPSAIVRDPIALTFALPETALTGSVKLIVTGAAARTLTLAAAQETSGAHSFSFNPADPSGAAQIASITGGASIPDGVYTLTLSYQDLLGNAAATATATDVRIDTTPPTLNLPAPFTTTATSPAGAVVSYSFSPTDPGGSGVVSFNSNPPSGSTFPIGMTTVNATATDNAGNNALGSFTVTVNSNPPPTGGSFTITPNSGVHQGDPLTLVAAGWTDPDLPLTYQFFNGLTPLNSPGASLTLNLNAPAPGSYTLKVRVTDSAGSFTEATQLLTVVVFTSAETWRQFYFGDYHNTGNRADTADFDLDGRLNLEEFAFGTDPTTGASGPGPLIYGGTFAGGGAVTFTGQPVTVFERIPNGIDFRLLFNRRVNHAADGVSYFAEFSADMAPGSWVPGGIAPTVLATDGTMQVVSVPYLRFVGGKKAHFARVRVITVP